MKQTAACHTLKNDVLNFWGAAAAFLTYHDKSSVAFTKLVYSTRKQSVMDEARYKIILGGMPQPGFSATQMYAGLAKWFGITAEKAQAMTAQGPRTVKKNLTLAQAQHYVATLEKAGAVAHMELMPAVHTPVAGQAEAVVVHAAAASNPSSAQSPPAVGRSESFHAAALAPGARYRASRRDDDDLVAGFLDPHGISGRIGRLRYLAWCTAVFLCALLAMWIVTSVGIFPIILNPIIGLATIYYSVLFGGQRLHDMGFTAWFMALLLVPVVGQLLPLVLLFWPGKEEENEYGAPPPPNNVAVYALAALFPVVIIGGPGVFR